MVWHPFLLGDIRAIEMVQRHVTKIVPSLKDISIYIYILVSDHLVSLNLPSLLHIRRRMHGY